MAIAWFICNYKRENTNMGPTRYCAMDDFTAQINADGGRWAESEVLGGYAVVKVKATAATLDLIAAAANFQRIPRVAGLGETLASLSTAQRNAIRSKLNDMGYTDAEMLAILGGDWAAVTLGQVLRFAAQRRLRPRYDAASDQIILDGAFQDCRPIDNVDAEVQ